MQTVTDTARSFAKSANTVSCVSVSLVQRVGNNLRVGGTHAYAVLDVLANRDDARDLCRCHVRTDI